MGELLSLKCFLFVGMAGEADFVLFRYQLLGKRALVGTMAYRAAANRYRTVDKLLLDHAFVMTGETELGRVRHELKFKGGFMRIVTIRAFSFLDRGMNILHGVLRIMTFVTHLADVFNLLEFVFACILMASRACPGGDGAMYKLVLPHLVMALGCHAVLIAFLYGGNVTRDKQGSAENSKYGHIKRCGKCTPFHSNPP